MGFAAQKRRDQNHYTADEIQKYAKMVFVKNWEHNRELGYDISGQNGHRFLYEFLGIRFSLSPREMETVFWNGASMGAIMPNADLMLGYINKKSIRSAVISNLLWSGEALAERFSRLLPNNRFEFVITSSDYLFRKPNAFCSSLLCAKREWMQKTCSIVVTIRKQMWKALHRWVSSRCGMTTTPKKSIKIDQTKPCQTVSICIFMLGKPDEGVQNFVYREE